MENKLQQLTEKLYNEGLSKGRADADAILAKANADSAKIIGDAKATAAKIVDDAKKSADDMRVNTQTEIRLAGQQAISAIKQQVEGMIVAQTITEKVTAAWTDNSFLKELILGVVKQWDMSGNGPSLEVMLPEPKAEELTKALKAAVGQSLGAGFEVVVGSNVKTPFKVSPKGAGYYISFTDADFDALLKEYLRSQVAELLYGEK